MTRALKNEPRYLEFLSIKYKTLKAGYCTFLPLRQTKSANGSFFPTNVINNVFFHFSYQASCGVCWTPHETTNIHFKTSVISIFNSFWKLTGRYWILDWICPWTVKVICKIILFIFFLRCLMPSRIAYLVLNGCRADILVASPVLNIVSDSSLLVTELPELCFQKKLGMLFWRTLQTACSRINIAVRDTQRKQSL